MAQLLLVDLTRVSQTVYCSGRYASVFIVGLTSSLPASTLHVKKFLNVFTKYASFALLLLSLLPTIAMSAAWTSYSGARLVTALYLIPANLLCAAFIGLPVILPLFVGKVVDLQMSVIVKNILMVFGIPLIVGDLTRRVLIRWKGDETFKKKIKPNLSNISALGILVLVSLVMLQKRNTIIIENSHLFLKIIIPVLLYYVVMYAASIALFFFLTRNHVLPAKKAIIIIYTSVARHINISLAVVLSAFTIEQSSLMVLFILVAYIVQVPSLAFFSQHFGARLVQRPS